METKITHTWENKRYIKWETFHEDTAPKPDILQMDDAQNGETPKRGLDIQNSKKIPEKGKVQMVTSAFLQNTMAIIMPIKHRHV